MRTIARNATWGHLSSLGYKLAQGPRVLVVDFELFIRAKPTDFSAHHKPAAAWTVLIVHPLAVHSWSETPLCHFINYTSLFTLLKREIFLLSWSRDASQIDKLNRIGDHLILASLLSLGSLPSPLCQPSVH